MNRRAVQSDAAALRMVVQTCRQVYFIRAQACVQAFSDHCPGQAEQLLPFEARVLARVFAGCEPYET